MLKRDHNSGKHAAKDLAQVGRLGADTLGGCNSWMLRWHTLHVKQPSRRWGGGACLNLGGPEGGGRA